MPLPRMSICRDRDSPQLLAIDDAPPGTHVLRRIRKAGNCLGQDQIIISRRKHLDLTRRTGLALPAQVSAASSPMSSERRPRQPRGRLQAIFQETSAHVTHSDVMLD